MKKDIVVAGAGLAGLACARHLQRSGFDCVVIEAGDAIGGRVRTDQVDGFRLDRGFQVLLTAYPAAKRELDYGRLDLRPFRSGSLIRTSNGFERILDPARHPLGAPSTLRASVGTLGDKLRMLPLRRGLGNLSVEEIFSRPELGTSDVIRQRWGFSERMAAEFFRPFIGGVTLDPSLSVSSRTFEFVMKMFVEGDAAVPSTGMQAIPEQIAADLADDSVILETRVTGVSAGGSVELEGGSRIDARAVVVATDGRSAARLLGTFEPPTFNGTVCVYFAADKAPMNERLLILDPHPKTIINNAVVMSNVAPELAPDGQSLVSATLLGEPGKSMESLVDQVRSEFRTWFGPMVSTWRHLATYVIPGALPAQPPGVLEPVAKPAVAGDGLFVCGDYRHHASIHGALESGRAAALAASSYLNGQTNRA